MIPLTEHRPSMASRAKGEVSTSDFIPYTCHYDNETLLTKTGELIQFLKVEGLSFESEDDQTLAFKKDLRNTLLKSIASPSFALWFHILRSRQPTFPTGEFTPGFARDLNDQWKTKNQGRQLFENQFYISIVHRGLGAKIGGLKRIFNSLLHKEDETKRLAFHKKAAQELTDVRKRFEASLADYGPSALSTRPSRMGRVSEPQAFLSRLLNFEQRPVRVSPLDISRALCTKRLFFGQNAIEVRGATSSKLAAMISIKEYGAETGAGMLDHFLRLPLEFVITQSFLFSHRQEALLKMQRQQRLLERSEDLAVSQVDEIGQALDEATSGTIAFGDHHLTVMPIASSMVELNDAVAAIESEMMNLGIMGVREDLNLEPCFWAQLPGNADYIARRATISTANLASFASLHNFPSGRLKDNHWGTAVTVLETQSGTPYFFNFHVNDVGHTTVIGPTGTGKTVLLNFLCAQARKFSGRLFFFDNDRGAEIFLRAMGGIYSVLSGGEPSGFNPLQLPDTPENRAFLTVWLQSLVTQMGEPFTSQDLSVVSQAVNGSYKLASEDRTLAKIAPFFGLPIPGSLAGRLSIWHSDGAYKNLFGNETDVLSLNQNIAGFEMGPILQNPQMIAPVLLYLFHRIELVLDGTPTMIVLDEAWALLDNPIFAPRIKEWLKTLRKQNAIVVFATQSVEDAEKSSISDTLVQQSVTHIYFPNAKASEAYRRVFKLSERELEIVRTLDPSSRSFLLKQGRDVVVAKLDLSSMPEIISVLSGRAETVAQLDRVRAQFGDSPDVWMPHFLEAVCEQR